MPELARAAEAKVSHPMYAAVVRIATKAETFERALQMACDLAEKNLFRRHALPPRHCSGGALT